MDWDWYYWHQCVDLVRDYVSKVYNTTLWPSGWSALTMWHNKSWTFNNEWERVENDYTKPNQVPPKGAILCMTGHPEYWHIGMVLEAKKWENKITVLDQNTWNGDGYGADDYVTTNIYSYKKVLGWYIKKEVNHDIITEYKWLKVISKKWWPKWVVARYSRWTKRISLFPIFYKYPPLKQEATLEHELSHHIWYTIPKNYQDLWKKISQFDEQLIGHINLITWANYTKNYFITPHAWDNYKEDFSEQIEHRVLVKWKYKKFGDIRDLKYKLACLLYDKYTKNT